LKHPILKGLQGVSKRSNTFFLAERPSLPPAPCFATFYFGRGCKARSRRKGRVRFGSKQRGSKNSKNSKGREEGKKRKEVLPFEHLKCGCTHKRNQRERRKRESNLRVKKPKDS